MQTILIWLNRPLTVTLTHSVITHSSHWDIKASLLTHTLLLFLPSLKAHQQTAAYVAETEQQMFRGTLCGENANELLCVLFVSTVL